jgi:hypothetical protein
MVNLCLEADSLLFAKFQLQLDDLLLLPQPSNYRPKLGKLAIRRVFFSHSWGSRRVRSITDLRSLCANRLEMVMEKGILRNEVLAANGKINK